jgi:hypothetical protein
MEGRRMKAMRQDEEVHVFERAGLGRAPFRVVGFQEKRGPIMLDTGLTVGAPGQPMGTCDYCGTGIANCYQICSADDKPFVVGSECVRKTDDAGLKRCVSVLRTSARHSSNDARIESAAARLPELLDAWTAEPHPVMYLAAKGLTRADWAQWMLAHAGRKGKLTVASAIERAISEG